MAILKNGILGGFAGKVGTVVGSIWKGISTMRAYVATISNPNTMAQLEQRAKFALVMAFLKPLTSFLRVGYKNLAIGQTTFNAAFSENYKHITGAYPAIEMDYTTVILSKGNLAGALNPVAASTTPGEVEFTWEDNSWETGAALTDEVVLVVYNPARQAAVSVIGGATRATGSFQATMPDSFAGDEVQCYIAFKNAKGDKISNSQFVAAKIVT